MARRHPRGRASLLALAVLLAACGGTDDTELVVFAAASLRDAFEELAMLHEDANPGTRVLLNVAGSQTLAAQVRAGAPADVIAVADPDLLAALDREGLLGTSPVDVATNGLVIAVEPGNPLRIEGLDDLANPAVAVVLAAPEVPAGGYAADALAAAGVEVSPVSLELDVRAALAKVVLGEADAAVVYATDVAASSGAADAVPVAAAFDVEATYPLAVVADTALREEAEAFVALVTSERGRAVLGARGFGPP